jgi:hypothetical protein
VQWDFAGRLGPPPGRYVVRRFAGDDAREVIVVAESGTPAAPGRLSRLAGRRPRRVAAPAPVEAVPVTRVTVVDAKPLRDGPAWLGGAARDPHLAEEAAAALVRLVAAHRIAAGVPMPDPDPARALATRVGYGTGAQAAEGEWESALEIPPVTIRGARRRRASPPEGERLSALLAGRDAPLACEELALRARADLDHDRPREAALQLEASLRAALAELSGWREQGDMARRLDELHGYAEPVAAAAAAAREGRLDPAGVETVSAGLARLEAALRARALHAG